MGPSADEFEDGQVIRSTRFKSHYTAIVTKQRTNPAGYVCLVATRVNDGWYSHPYGFSSGDDLEIVTGAEADAILTDYMRALLLGEVETPA